MTSITSSASHCAFIDVFINHWSNNWSPGFLVFLKHHGCFKFPVKCRICFVLTCHYSNVPALTVVARAPSTAVAGVGSAFCFGSTLLFPHRTIIQILWHLYGAKKISSGHTMESCVCYSRGVQLSNRKTLADVAYISLNVKPYAVVAPIPTFTKRQLTS